MSLFVRSLQMYNGYVIGVIMVYKIKIAIIYSFTGKNITVKHIRKYIGNKRN